MSHEGEARRNQEQARALIDALVAAGVRHAVLSPGSRNTPIVLALHDLARAGRPITLHSVLDERSAGFFALGLARISGAPTVLSCTSGSAAAHYLPAFVEAAQAHVPLIAITADRPPELHGRGAPQTVPQVGMFAPHVRWSFDLATPSDLAGTRWLAGIAARAVDAATGTLPGPVHINAPFRKPLWATGASTDIPATSQRDHQIIRGTAVLPDRQLEALAQRLRAVDNGCIVWGPDPNPSADPAAIAALATHLGWPVIADPVSPLRYGPDSGATVVCTADAFLRDAQTAARLSPGLILRLGGTPSSKPLNQWMAQAADVIALDPLGEWRDPEHALSTVIAADPTKVAQALVTQISAQTPGPWLESWAAQDRTATAALQTACQEGWWSGAIVRRLVHRLPEGSLLHVASSMPIRDLDTFGGRGADIRVTANRGANGIDGTIATTLGQAAAWDQGPILALMGDLAFLHDQGSLMLASGCRRPVALVVIDNGGGGIFDHLPIAAHPTAYNDWFRTPQVADIPALCTAAGLPCVSAVSRAALEHGIGTALERRGVTVIVATIDAPTDLETRREAWASAVESR